MTVAIPSELLIAARTPGPTGACSRRGRAAAAPGGPSRGAAARVRRALVRRCADRDVDGRGAALKSTVADGPLWRSRIACSNDDGGRQRSAPRRSAPSVLSSPLGAVRRGSARRRPPHSRRSAARSKARRPAERPTSSPVRPRRPTAWRSLRRGRSKIPRGLRVTAAAQPRLETLDKGRVRRRPRRPVSERRTLFHRRRRLSVGRHRRRPPGVVPVIRAPPPSAPAPAATSERPATPRGRAGGNISASDRGPEPKAVVPEASRFNSPWPGGSERPARATSRPWARRSPRTRRRRCRIGRHIGRRLGLALPPRRPRRARRPRVRGRAAAVRIDARPRPQGSAPTRRPRRARLRKPFMPSALRCRRVAEPRSGRGFHSLHP